MINPLINTKDFKRSENLSEFVIKNFSMYVGDESMSKVLENCPFPSCESLRVPKMDDAGVNMLKDDKINIPVLKSD